MFNNDRWHSVKGDGPVLAAMRAAASPAGLGSARAYDPLEEPRSGLINSIGVVERMAQLLRGAQAWVSRNAMVPGEGNKHLQTEIEAVIGAFAGAAPRELNWTTQMDPSMWTAEDQRVAAAEGWDVFENSERGLEIERDDDMAAFASDAEAAGHVYLKAMEGSPVHQRAMHLTLSRVFAAALNDHGGIAQLTAHSAGPGRVGIRIEGGQIQSVFTDRAMDVIVVDYDTDDCTPAELTEIPQDDERTAPAVLSVYSAVVMPEECERLHRLVVAGPPSLAALTREAEVADEAFQSALVRTYGEHLAGDMRYVARHSDPEVTAARDIYLDKSQALQRAMAAARETPAVDAGLDQEQVQEGMRP